MQDYVNNANIDLYRWLIAESERDLSATRIAIRFC